MAAGGLIMIEAVYNELKLSSVDGFQISMMTMTLHYGYMPRKHS